MHTHQDSVCFDLAALKARARELARDRGIKLAKAQDIVAAEVGRPFGITNWPLLSKLVKGRGLADSVDPLIAWFRADQGGDAEFLERVRSQGELDLILRSLEPDATERLMGTYGLEALKAAAAFARLGGEDPIERRERLWRGYASPYKPLPTGKYVIVATPEDIHALSRHPRLARLEQCNLYACGEIDHTLHNASVLPPKRETVMETTSLAEVARFIGDRHFIVFNRATLDTMNAALRGGSRPVLNPAAAVFVAERAKRYAMGVCDDDIYGLGYQDLPSLDLPETPEQITGAFVVRFIAEIMDFIIGMEEQERALARFATTDEQ